MDPQWTSALGVLFVVLAGVQMWLMLESMGRHRAVTSPGRA